MASLRREGQRQTEMTFHNGQCVRAIGSIHNGAEVGRRFCQLVARVMP
jgi:hypothetical protein